MTDERPPGDRIVDPRRLAAVHATGLLDTSAEEPFDRLSRLAASILGTPMAFMTVVDDERSFWKSRIGVPEDATQNTVSESFCQYVVSSGAGLVAGDAAAHPVTRHNPSIESMGVRAWAGFPVRAPGGQVLGTFCVVDTVPRQFRADQLEALESLAEAASAEIALRLTVHALEEISATLRESLLPPVMPSVPGLDVAAVHVPASDGEGVLGDFYDAFEGGPGQWWFAIGDVCGHGPQAAKCTGLARWSIRAHATHDASPQGVLGELNRQLLQRTEPHAPHVTSVLVTVAVDAVTDDGSLTVDLAVAGHPPPRLVRADGTVTLAAISGTALGWFPEPSIGSGSETLAPGDALVLFTDGVLEAGETAAMFGEDGLDSCLAALGGSSAEDVVTAVVDAAIAHGHERRDDIAVLVLANPLPRPGRSEGAR